MFMDKNNPFEILSNVSANALSNSLQALSLVKVLRKELATFISKNSSEKEEDILKRIDKSYVDEFKKELENVSEPLKELLEPLLKKVQENEKS